MIDKNIVSVFESSLTRTLNIKDNMLSEDIIIVQTYYFQVLKQLILNGFIHNNEKYVVFTASAGQIRTKKTVFIKEKVLEQYQDTLMCGISPESINDLGGVNINKYLAYLALCNSATDQWLDIDLNKVIVVEDMETPVRSIVDYFDEKTYEITRKDMDVLIPHTDGCGMILPKKSKKNFMIRMPWIKGLLVSFPFDKFVREENRKRSTNDKIGYVKDIYGKEYHILDDDIEIILTKSQFKMWKYYSSWDDYKYKYREYNCQTGVCNVEEDNINNTRLNYQMLQTLSDITDEELKKLCKTTNDIIDNISSDKETMLRALGATKSNTKKNHFQQALEIYPELLTDTYSKDVLKSVKKSIVDNAKAGKIDVDGKYTFICPDLYAFCEFTFLNIKLPAGLLKNGEIFCDLYKNIPKLDCLRSPHLYLEHAVRNNVFNKEIKRWFTTKGLYVSCHDPISKILMCDWDGDKSLVCADQLLIEIAERNMVGIVPLQYDMAKAEASFINNQSIFDGLRAAYSGGNIGVISNDITKIWNSDNINLDAIKWLCAENNFTIDYAKTLYKPKRPEFKNKIIKSYTKLKTPYFFKYAKAKTENEVEQINDSVVNRLGKHILNINMNFRKAKTGKIDYRMLLHNNSFTPDEIYYQTVVDKYNSIDCSSLFSMNVNLNEYKNMNLFVETRNEINSVSKNNLTYAVDCLVYHLYEQKKDSNKNLLWFCFGDIIVENIKSKNLIFNVNILSCASCGNRISKNDIRQRYCQDCKKLKRQETWRNSKNKSNIIPHSSKF